MESIGWPNMGQVLNKWAWYYQYQPPPHNLGMSLLVQPNHSSKGLVVLGLKQSYTRVTKNTCTNSFHKYDILGEDYKSIHTP